MKALLDDVKTNGTLNDHDPFEVSEISNEELLIKDALFVRHDGSLVKLKHVDILWLKGDGNYTTIVARHSVFSVRNLLKDFEDVLGLSSTLTHDHGMLHRLLHIHHCWSIS